MIIFAMVDVSKRFCTFLSESGKCEKAADLLGFMTKKPAAFWLRALLESLRTK